MSGPVIPAAGGVAGARPAADPAAKHAALRRQCHELEGVFVRQLFEAMRKATPRGDGTQGSPGEGAFTEMLDDALASRAAAGLERGLGEAMYRQLSRRLDAQAPAPGAPAAPGPARGGR